MDEKRLEEDPLPVIAWRIGYGWVLPVTCLGDAYTRTEQGPQNCEHYTLGPDGKVLGQSRDLFDLKRTLGVKTDAVVAAMSRAHLDEVRTVNPALRLRRFRVEPGAPDALR